MPFITIHWASAVIVVVVVVSFFLAFGWVGIIGYVTGLEKQTIEKKINKNKNSNKNK